MPANVSQARDQMNGVLKAAMDAAGSPINTIVLIWDDTLNDPEPPATPTPWARVSIRHNKGQQGSLSGALGKQRWVRSGFISVQLFTFAGKGNVVSDQIIAIIQTAYEGKTTVGGLIFRNVRFTEIGQSGPWLQVNITIDFEYDEIK